VRDTGELEMGQEVGMLLGAGHEVYCARGRLRLLSIQPGPGGGALLATGQGWRCGCATRITLRAEEPSRWRVVSDRA
jgi:hypothetical protein